ncbi:olfactory receptor 52B2-like [Egretta garzetta]|uniref:olfactory receptor 52B2-like n=1 Tax=Egretta garzetta TaxID=188379 RepID=UPI00051EFC25|nr:olfactory receptor 52B2-like [Egretta garzetta]
MAARNQTSLQPASFLLLGMAGLEDQHAWLSVPFCLMYITALLSNLILLIAIVTERSLHKPMYLFLAMLAVADLVLSSSTVPKALSVFWSLSKEISFRACLTQMFFIHLSFVAESTVLLAMAFDRYVAICSPLRYATVFTHSVVAKVGLAAIARSFCVMFPTIFLLQRLPYCRHRVMPHTYCEHMGIARLACADISINIWYGFATTLLCPGVDVVLIGVSYVLILRAVFRLSSKDAQRKAVGTCSSHACVIFVFYTPAFFSFFTHRFGHNVPHHVHILLANLYVLLPPMLNPIIYAMKNKLIREKVSQVLFRMVQVR